MNEIIVVLGSPNSPEGILSDIAISRLNYCLQLFKPESNFIICTGGFGGHFNTSPKPHAEYAMEYLMKHGIDKSSFMEMVLSSNTVDDAVKLKEILAKYPMPCKIITSEYHRERVKIIFDQILTGVEMNYFGAKHEISDEELEKLLEHEKKAISQILKNGLYY